MEQLEIIKGKITSPETLVRLRAIWKFKGQKVVFTNGCFDLIHRGHIEYLARARDHGNILVIGLNTDSSVSRIKGPGRPIQDEQTRAFVLASFSFVNNVVYFNEDTPYDLIALLRPDVLVKGGDYAEHEIVGADLVKGYGGKVAVIPLILGHSTTALINKLSG